MCLGNWCADASRVCGITPRGQTNHAPGYPAVARAYQERSLILVASVRAGVASLLPPRSAGQAGRGDERNLEVAYSAARPRQLAAQQVAPCLAVLASRWLAPRRCWRGNR